VKRGSAALLILVALAAVPATAQVPDVKSQRSKLIALENAWNQAQIHRDGKALDTLIGEKFVYTDTDGTVMNKARFMADVQDPTYQASAVSNTDVEVYFYPGVAVVTGAYHAKGKNQGKPYDHHGRFTDTWIFIDGYWQCVASHTNLIAPK
jgi:uncharacterized protein DUF4440